MNYEAYKKSRNASWDILLDTGITTLPVKISDVCKRLGIAVRSYRNFESLLPKDAYGYAGLIKVIHDEPVVLYRTDMAPAFTRTAIAIGLGHILAVKDVQQLDMHPILFESKRTEDVAAIIFASQLLAPACVLWGLKIEKADEIMKICDISPALASRRAARMWTLYEREKDFITSRGKSCFLLSSKEQKLYDRFLPFIKGYMDKSSSNS